MCRSVSRCALGGDQRNLESFGVVFEYSSVDFQSSGVVLTPVSVVLESISGTLEFTWTILTPGSSLEDHGVIGIGIGIVFTRVLATLDVDWHDLQG